MNVLYMCCVVHVLCCTRVGKHMLESCTNASIVCGGWAGGWLGGCMTGEKIFGRNYIWESWGIIGSEVRGGREGGREEEVVVFGIVKR